MSLADKMDILEVIARYAYTCDGRDADGFAQLFTEDGILEVIPTGGNHPELRLESRAAIHAWASQRHHQVVKGIQDRHYELQTDLGLGEHQVSTEEGQMENSFGIVVLADLRLIRACHQEILPGTSWSIAPLQHALRLHVITNHIEHNVKTRLTKARKAA
jgi:hypothetical protein